MNIRDLVYVESISTHKNFSRAALSCNVSQPALSNQIKKLEQELGVSLFERRKNEVYITEFGEKVVGIAKQIITQAEAIREIAMEYRDVEASPFRLGLTPTLAPYLAKYFKDMLSNLYPNMRFVLVEGKPIELSQMVENKEVDIALIARNSYDLIYDTAKKDIIDFAPLWTESLYLAVRHGHPLATKKNIFAKNVPADLLMRFTVPFGYELEKNLPEQTMDTFEQAGFDIKSARFETVCRHIIHSEYCTIVNAIAAEQFKQDNWKLDFIEFQDKGNYRELGMIYRHGYNRDVILDNISNYIDNSPPIGAISKFSKKNSPTAKVLNCEN